ncbi:hypothetical protein FACS1894139_04560 [Planctomycetales bacterium]|nr:hypothetical protein FACS1894107_09160 [Planctomycetales bacterium]GHS99055.1 hypothetical protein FACS1894108_08340 [Planctomycetales bacterium]GHT03684.1 hypothetical protein FACS1894139_04560 [Planctomycetales bacterium]
MATEPITPPKPEFSREKRVYLSIFAVMGAFLIVVLAAELWAHHKIDNDLWKQTVVIENSERTLTKLEDAGQPNGNVADPNKG